MKKMYARMYAYSNEVPERKKGVLTSGKKYEILFIESSFAFYIKGDYGQEVYCLFKGCSHLDGKNWETIKIYRNDNNFLRFWEKRIIIFSWILLTLIFLSMLYLIVI
jgi:hypothetical protein